MHFSASIFGRILFFNYLLCSNCNENEIDRNELQCGNEDDFDTTPSKRQTGNSTEYPSLPKRIAPRLQGKRNFWKITKYPEVLDDHTTVEGVDAAANEAFQLWSSVCNLDFYQTDSEIPDIEIKFETSKSHDRHCTVFSKNEYGHYVKKSQNPAKVHINAIVEWKINVEGVSDDSINLVFLLAHEIGHVLGFGHNNLTDSIMFRYYYKYESNTTVELSSDDAAAAAKRYGIRKNYCDKPMEQFAYSGKTNKRERRFTAGISQQRYRTIPERIGVFNKSRIFWKITKYPTVSDEHTTAENVDAAAREAFRLWSSACNLNFYQTASNTNSNTNIEMRFDKTKVHNRYCVEDFQIQEFAHYVRKSKNPTQIHFNDDVEWSVSSSEDIDNSVNLIFVFAHEIGHAMGFAHNNLNDSIMFRNYYDVHSGATVKLSSDDIEAAAKRYGVRKGFATKPVKKLAFPKTFSDALPGLFKRYNTWKISKYPTQIDEHTTVANVDAAANEAFQLWSSACNLDFFQTDSETPDIEIKFETAKVHNRYCTDDFRTGENVHYVRRSQNPAQIHFNDDVVWSTGRLEDTDDSMNLIFVFAHEIGHIMGFAHNNLNDSAMFKYYQDYHSDATVELSSDDVAAAISRYGTRKFRDYQILIPMGQPDQNPKLYDIVAVCMEVYQLENCGGNKIILPEGRHRGLQYIIDNHDKGGNRSNIISSVRVAPNCRARYCRSVGRNCTEISGNDTSNLDNRLDTQIEEIGCYCSPCHQQFQLTSGNSTYICAVAYASPLCENHALLIESKLVQPETIERYAEAVHSVQINPGCSLKLCLYDDPTADQFCMTLEGGPSGKSYPRLNSTIDGATVGYCSCT